MIRRLCSADARFDRELAALLAWETREAPEAARIAADTIADVREHGDAALVRLSRQFDGVEVANAGALVLDEADLDAALAGLPRADRRALEAAAERIRRYHESQPSGAFEYQDELGNRLGQRTTPLDRCGHLRARRSGGLSVQPC